MQAEKRLERQKKSGMTLSQRGRIIVAGLVAPIVNGMARLGITPMQLTVAGLLANMVAGWLLAVGKFRLGGAVLLLLGPLDLFDGALARKTGQSSQFGAFLDSTFDRLSEGALYLGLLWYYSGQAAGAESVLVYLSIVGSLLVSYTRSRAETLGVDCQTGLMTRFERFVLILIGLFSGYVTATLAAMALLTFVTVYQRIRFTQKSLAAR